MTKEDQKQIEEAVKRAVKEYGETLKLLASDEPEHSVSKWIEVGKKRGYFDYWLSTVEWPEKQSMILKDALHNDRAESFNEAVDACKEAITKSYE